SGAGTMVGRGKRTAHRSRSSRVGIFFPVGRIDRLLRHQGNVRRVHSTASVYLAAVLDYLTAELVDVAGYVAQHFKSRRIDPRHLLLAIRKDEELKKLLADFIPQGGVMPNI
ncbi:H2AJ protein, partial [Thryothorus ludovicianus]|nr:H2AJ protein [Thryothorus ludovicianus]